MKAAVAFRTLGCKQNQFDTQSLRNHILNCGFKEVEQPEEANWLVLNTCAVTERAMAKARGEMNRSCRLNPDLRIVAVGCGVHCDPGNFKRADYLNAFPPEFGMDDRESHQNPVDLISDLPAPHGYIPAGKSRALLRIQSGCDQFCSFCIVPHLRGASRSVPLSECVESLKELVGKGASEIVLTGTNIALWGRDLPGKTGLRELLESLVKRTGKARLRLSSLEPQLISPELIEWCLAQPQICRHFHIAVQSGSSRALKLMRRGEPSPDLFPYLTELKELQPDISIGADIIAGLPGETEEDANETVELIHTIPFSYLHVFPYSERPGTEAVNFTDHVPKKIRLNRAKSLRQMDISLRRRFASLNDGCRQDIVVLDGKNKNKGVGLTSNYLKVSIDSNRMPSSSRFTSHIKVSDSFLTTT